MNLLLNKHLYLLDACLIFPVTVISVLKCALCPARPTHHLIQLVWEALPPVGNVTGV
jgi:hypothetical protein